MPSTHLTLREEDIIRLILEFLQNRGLNIAQLGIERETGVINGFYSDDVLFLRQLILDGQWDDVLEFIQPMEALQEFDARRFRFLILQHKYVELLCIKSEAACVMGTSTANLDSAVEEVVKVLQELEKVAPTKEDYSNLCMMLTLPRLSDHLNYKDWNPSSARVQCFRDIYPLVEKFLPPIGKAPPPPPPMSVGDKTAAAGSGGDTIASNDRLIQLIIKGILYESCVRFCQAKASAGGGGAAGAATTVVSALKEQYLLLHQEINFTRLLDGSVGFGDSDLSLLSWLQNVPADTFAIPFEQKTLNIDVEQIDRPSLETSWTEHMLITPIKPKTFPHSAMPFTRPRSAADIMSRSLMPSLDILPNGAGAAHDMTTSSSYASQTHNKLLMALSMADMNSAAAAMTKSSFASFHLSGLKPINKSMNTSVDKLFENENDVFLSGNFNVVDLSAALPVIAESRSHHSTPPPPPLPLTTQQHPSNNGGGGGGGPSGGSSQKSVTPPMAPSPSQMHHQQGGMKSGGGSSGSASSTPDFLSRENSNPATGRSSRRDSLCEKVPPQVAPMPMMPPPSPLVVATTTVPLAVDVHGHHQQQQGHHAAATAAAAENFDHGDLMNQFHRQKQRLHDTIVAQDRERQELWRQLQSTECKLQEDIG